MNEDQYLIERHRTVRKANQLIQKSRFSLSLQQQKVLLYLISQISPQDKDFKSYQFSISDFCKVCGITDSGTNYSDLKSVIKDIADKSLWVRLQNGRDTLLRWIEKAQIDEDSGLIEIRLDNDIKPFLLNLKENYTQYEMIFTLRFKSKYSIRLYELIKSVHYHEEMEYRKRYPVDELKRLLDAETYQQYRDFKRRVLTPCIKEINEHSDKNITFEEVGRGRKILAVEFIVSSKDTMEVIHIRSDIDKELGTDQLTLWEQIEQADKIRKIDADTEKLKTVPSF